MMERRFTVYSGFQVISINMKFIYKIIYVYFKISCINKISYILYKISNLLYKISDIRYKTSNEL